MYFTKTINGLNDWGNVFQDTTAFKDLITYIFKINKLPMTTIMNVTPGTNAVYKVGDYIIKIFAPLESTIGSIDDYNTEIYGIKSANSLNIACPYLIAYGEVKDKYLFNYLILEYINGVELYKKIPLLNNSDLESIGNKIRQMINTLDKPVKPFNHKEDHNQKWGLFPESFQKERLIYLHDIINKQNNEKVFIHADINPDNLIITNDLEIYLIDFADAQMGLIEMEYATIIFGFNFNKQIIKGLLPNTDPTDLLNILLKGILLHDYGPNMIRDTLQSPETIKNLKMLTTLIKNKIK